MLRVVAVLRSGYLDSPGEFLSSLFLLLKNRFLKEINEICFCFFFVGFVYFETIFPF